MNVQLRQKPFQKRKPNPIAAQATGSAETFVRYVATKAAGLLGQDEGKFASIKWPADRRLHGVIRASAEPPTDLSNTPALAVMGTDFVESLQPISAAARLFRASRLMLNFDRFGAITVPDLFGIDEGPPAWVESGRPAPVGELTANATILQPFKLEFIVTVTREMILGSNAERLLGDALRAKIAFDLDKTLFDALPEDAARPAGMRSYNARLPESNWTSGNDVAMMRDVGSLIAAAESIAGGEDFYLIARSRRIAAMRQMYKIVPPNLVLLPSAASLALPDSVLLCVVPRAVPSAIGLAEVELVESATVEVDDSPGGPDFSTASNVRSFFQSDTLGLKVRLPASWGLRHPAGANWITCLWPSDIGGSGGGGLPDAPSDEFHYGRHQGGWEPVIEEAPATPVNTAFVRTNNAAALWWPLDTALLNYAPLASPGFVGTPTAPTPPQGDNSTRLATTAFVAGAGGGVEEGPQDGFTYGRRNLAWQQLETVFAPLNSPTFTGTPSAPSPPPGDASTRLATTQFVADNAGAGGVDDVPATPNGAYARIRSGGTTDWMDFVTLRVASLDNPVFAPGALTNVGIGFGDNLTGLYRSGSLIAFAFNGVIPIQVMTTSVAAFVPVNVPDATGDAEAVNRRSADARYLQRSGGQMTGALISAPGTGPTNPGVGIGDNVTGFYRDGTSLAIAALGDPHMFFHSNRTAQLMWPLSLSSNVISALGDATAPDHALSRGVADARYLGLVTGGIVQGAVQFLFNPVIATDAVTKGYVDQRRAPSLFVEPAAVAVPVNHSWVSWWLGDYAIPRGGDSRLMVSVAINIDQPGSGGTTCILGVRCRSQPGVLDLISERHNFFYKPGPTDATGGISAQFFIDVSGLSWRLEIEVAVTGGTPTAALTTIAAGDARSQILITDLGPR